MGRSFFIKSSRMTRFKGIFENRSTAVHAVVLIYFLLFGFLLSAICGAAIMSVSNAINGNIADMPFYTQHGVQFVASLFLFALPAFGTAYCCSRNPVAFLHAEKIANAKVLLLSAVMLLLISPTIDFTAYFNSKMQLPDFMASVENWMREREDLTANMTERLLSEKGFFPFFTNILIIGVMAGVTEEFFFRGVILSLIREKIKNPHVAIWIVAILFSIIHFQFYGFIPRILLGAFLGYLLYWCRTIWIPIFVHFLNNTIAVVGYKTGFSDVSDNSTLITDAASREELLYMGVIAIAGLLLFGFCAKKIKRDLA